LTAEVFKYYASVLEMSLGKFVIPNPFGPYEEPKFTSYLVRSWYEGKVPEVSAPDYIRDNIHVSLLARAYAHFAENLPEDAGFRKINPSGYPGSQAEFARRFAREMASRLPVPCEVKLGVQKEFYEPMVRVNTDDMAARFPDWSEDVAWDGLAEYYKSIYQINALKNNG
jgi:nucleoside-diphosphate-sugar epimerase